MAASIESSDGEFGFQIAPMVDVVFVLMLFFMAATGAQVSLRELTAALPSPAHSGGEPTVAIVEIAADGSVIFNGEALGTAQDIELPQLRARFHHIIEQFGDKDAVVIRPAASVRHERVIQVLSAVQSGGVSKVTFL